MAVAVPTSPATAAEAPHSDNNSASGMTDTIWSSLRLLETSFRSKDESSQGSQQQRQQQQQQPQEGQNQSYKSQGDATNTTAAHVQQSLEQVIKFVFSSCSGTGDDPLSAPTNEVSFSCAKAYHSPERRSSSSPPRQTLYRATRPASPPKEGAAPSRQFPYVNHRGVIVTPGGLSPTAAKEAVYKELLMSDQLKAEQAVSHLRQQLEANTRKPRGSPIKAVMVPGSSSNAKELLRQQQQQQTTRNSVSTFFPISSPKSPTMQQQPPPAAAVVTPPSPKPKAASPKGLAAPSFDDGVSCISQHTLNDLANLYDQQPMQRVSSETTHDPGAPRTGESWKATVQRRRRFHSVVAKEIKTTNAASATDNNNNKNLNRSLCTIDSAASQTDNYNGNTSGLRRQRSLEASPVRMALMQLSSNQSTGTCGTRDRTVASKSTVSTHTTNDFASAWRKDEAQYWQDVAEEEDVVVPKTKSSNASQSSSKYEKFKKYRELKRRSSPHRSMRSKRDGTITTAGSSTNHTHTTRQSVAPPSKMEFVFPPKQTKGMEVGEI